MNIWKKIIDTWFSKTEKEKNVPLCPHIKRAIRYNDLEQIKALLIFDFLENKEYYTHVDKEDGTYFEYALEHSTSIEVIDYFTFNGDQSVSDLMAYYKVAITKNEPAKAKYLLWMVGEKLGAPCEHYKAKFIENVTSNPDFVAWEKKINESQSVTKCHDLRTWRNIKK